MPRRLSIQVPDQKSRKQISSLKGDIYLERKLNEIYFRWSFDYIKKNPVGEIGRIFYKLYYFWIADFRDPRSHSPVFLIPWLTLLLFSAFGIYYVRSWKKHYVLYLFLISNTFVVELYTVMARYQTLMKFVLIPFAATGLVMLYEKLTPLYRIIKNTAEFN